MGSFLQMSKWANEMELQEKQYVKLSWDIFCERSLSIDSAGF